MPNPAVPRRSFLKSASTMGALAGASLSGSGAAIASGFSSSLQLGNEPADTKHPKLSLIARYSQQTLRFAASAGYEGVVLRVDADTPELAWIAWATYHEPYLALPMRHHLSEESKARTRTYEYAWKLNGAWHSLGAEVHGEAQPFTAGSREEFIFQRYWGYTRQRDGGTVEYEVEHSRWGVWSAVSVSREGDLAGLYGSALAGAMKGAPVSTLVTDGSPIVIRRPMRIG